MKVSFNKILKGSEGLTLFMVLFVMAFFLVFVTGGLFFAQVNLKIASNFKLATQAVEVADAGLQHGLAVVPWVWDFDSQLNCASPPCTIIAQTSFPSGSGFSYTVTAQNDVPDMNNGGSPTNDTNNIILLASQAKGPSGSARIIVAYVRRSVAPFTPPAALYINAASSSPVFGPGTYYFDANDSMKIIGNDTNPGDLLNNADDTPGPKAPLLGLATTSDAVTGALKNEYQYAYNGNLLHDILGVGSEPSISTTSDVLDIDTIANYFFNAPGTVQFLTGLVTDATTCPTSTPMVLAAAAGPPSAPPGQGKTPPGQGTTPPGQGGTAPGQGGTPPGQGGGGTTSNNCVLGTSTTPQITYIKDDGTSITSIKGNVTGVGVLVLEGRTTIGDNFRFAGLVVHKRSDSSHYISFDNNAWVYGAVLVGSFDENDGMGKKARFRVRDFSQLFYSSKALALVDSYWGPLLPKPARVFAWLDK